MILYQGPSRLTGEPIVAIATIDSQNPKTADMVQVWILRGDMRPMEAVRQNKDDAICGDCPQRWNLGGACYVIVSKAPESVYRRLTFGDGYQDENHIRRVKKALLQRTIRLGAYGDPCAVPFEVWESLIAQGCQLWTGYTHQWKDVKNQKYRELLMASCDSFEDAKQAKDMGWRFFLVQRLLETNLPALGKVIECPSTARDATCDDCTACDGTRADTRSTLAASIVIEVHGNKVRKWGLNVVTA